MLAPDAKFAPFAKTLGGRQEVTSQNLWRVVGREIADNDPFAVPKSTFV